MNRLSLTVGLAAMDSGWVVPWALLLGWWTDLAQPRGLLSLPSVFGLVLLGALSTQLLGRWALDHRAARGGLFALGGLAVLLAVRFDQYPNASGPGWLESFVRALAVVLGEPSGPALAFGLGLFLWWRGVRVGSQMPSFSDVESTFKWGIGWLVTFALVMAVSMRPGLLPQVEAQTTPFVVGFFFVSLMTLALARLESLRTRTSDLAVNSQWLGVLVLVAGLVVVSALVIGQLLSFDLLIVATRPVFAVLGQLLLLAVYLIVIPLAYVVEWLVYLLLRWLWTGASAQPPQLLQPADVENRLHSLLSQEIPPELLGALKAAGSALLLIAGLLVVARALLRWRRPSVDGAASVEERESLWEAGRLVHLLLGLWRRLFRRFAWAAPQSSVLDRGPSAGSDPGQPLSIRELYRQLLQLGESVGSSRGAATTPLEHLAVLQSSLEPAEDSADITRAYVSVRYADQEPSLAQTAAVREQLDRLRPRFQSEQQ